MSIAQKPINSGAFSRYFWYISSKDSLERDVRLLQIQVDELKKKQEEIIMNKFKEEE